MTNNLPQLHTIKDVETMANVVARSGLFGVKDPTQALALMLLCQAEGLHPMAACRQYHVIQGRASMTSQTMMSRFLQMGGKQEVHNLSEELADITLSHPSGGSVRVQWTIEHARRAGLANKENWKNHPRSMLLRRAQAEAVRAVAPFILEGLPVEDEAVEINDPSFLAPVKPDINIDKLPSLTEPKQEFAEIPLSKEWDKEAKARIAKEAKRIGGRVGTDAVAHIPVEKAFEFGEYIATVVPEADLFAGISAD
ncbi:MAG: hypothetical protein ACO3TI_07585 [Aquiluna sp.]